MTTIARTTPPDLTPAGAAARRAGRATVLRWEISPDALRRGAPALLNGLAGAVSGAALEWRLTPQAGRLAAAACVRIRRSGAAAEETVPLRRVDRSGDGPDALLWSFDAGLSLEHIDAGPLLRVTIRRGPGDPPGGTLVYARTDLLARLGLPGGVYDGPFADA